MTSELEPFCYLTQTSSAKNPPHGWSVHFIDGDIPLYTADALAAAREEGRQAGLDEGRAELKAVLTKILNEPDEAMSNGKALTEIMRIAKRELKEKRDEN